MKKRKGKISEKDTMNARPLMPYLPEEIIMEIHSRLPPRSLLKFRCVSKPWSVLYNNQKLIDMLQINFSIMLVSGKDIYSIDNESVSSSSSLLNGIDSRIEKINCPVDLGDVWKVRLVGPFVGCCNGLFCIRTTHPYGWHDFSLWNPSTRNYKQIPSPPDQYPVDGGSTRTGYGFVYDLKSDDYKFVCFTSYSNQSEAKIYSLRSNSWKRIQQIPCLLPVSGTQNYGAFCNGALHWKASSVRALIAFDTTDETVTQICKPEKLDVTFPNTTYIDVLDECLCMLHCNSLLGFEVCLMKDYGKKESWTRICSISKLTSLDVRRFRHLRKIKGLKTGEILLMVHYFDTHYCSRAALVLYDPKNETSKVLKLGENIWSSNSLLSMFHIYVKSSVSVSSGSGLVLMPSNSDAT